jgi:putative membrane protein
METFITPQNAYKENTNNTIWASAGAIIVHLAGVIGILFFKREWFLGLTPINLLLMFVFLIWTASKRNRIFYFFVLFAILLGLISEIIGVNTGFLFGKYSYGEVLGQKIWGVPLLISINWFMIVYASGIFTQNILAKTPVAIQIAIGGIIATFFDWIMEPAAMKLGFWKWDNGIIPLSNYVTWFCISALLLVLFYRCKFVYHPFAVYLLLIQAMFFLVLR